MKLSSPPPASPEEERTERTVSPDGLGLTFWSGPLGGREIVSKKNM